MFTDFGHEKAQPPKATADAGVDDIDEKTGLKKPPPYMFVVTDTTGEAIKVN